MILKKLDPLPSRAMGSGAQYYNYKRVQKYKKLNLFSYVLILLFCMLVFFQTKLFPLIYLYWQKYQSQLLKKLKSLRTSITIAGDGRHDSMGHSAKFGAYTIFCCTVPMIIHFSLVQVRLFLYHVILIVTNYYHNI